jgi:hypothetical protein
LHLHRRQLARKTNTRRVEDLIARDKVRVRASHQTLKRTGQTREEATPKHAHSVKFVCERATTV